MQNNLVLVAGAFLCTMFLILLIGTAVSSGGSSERRMRKRLARVSAGKAASGNVSATPTLRLASQESSMPMLDQLARRLLPNHAVLRQRLQRTGRQISIGQFCLWMAGTALVMTVLMTFISGLGLLPSLLIGVLAGLALPYWLIGRMATRRVARFNGLFPDAIDLIVRAIKSGLPITEAVITVGAEVPDPVGEEFRKIEGGMRVGRNLEDILWEVADRLATPEFRFFVISLSVQRQTGGNLAETLENLSEILRRRRQMVLKIKALTSEARASALILGSLPFVVLGMIMMITPSYITPLFIDARGNVMLVIAAIMLLTGAGIMAKMIKFEI